MTSKRPTRLDYCQYLLVRQINYTITNYADHTQHQMSHDAINRYLREDRLTPRLVWENVRAQIETSPHGYVVFDDTVLDKNFSHKIELVRRQCARADQGHRPGQLRVCQSRDGPVLG